MRNQIAYERAYRRPLKKYFKDQLAETLYNLEAKAASFNASTKDYAEQLFDKAAADKLMKEILAPVLASLSEDQGKLALAFAGAEGDFVVTARLLKIIENSTSKMAKRFNDNTLEKLNVSLAEGVAAGENLDKLTFRVNSIYKQADTTRSALIARTETLKASNYSTNEAYIQTGFVTGKQWYANPGACDICEEMDGRQAGLSEDFLKQGETLEYGDGQSLVNSYDDVGAPPVHPNCRCTIIPVR